MFEKIRLSAPFLSNQTAEMGRFSWLGSYKREILPVERDPLRKNGKYYQLAASR